MGHCLLIGPPGNWEMALQHQVWGLPARQKATWQRMGAR